MWTIGVGQKTKLCMNVEQCKAYCTNRKCQGFLLSHSPHTKVVGQQTERALLPLRVI